MPDVSPDSTFMEYLQETGLSGASDVLASSGITSLILLKELCSDEEIRTEIVGVIGAKGATVAARLAAKKLAALTAAEVQTWIDAREAKKNPVAPASPPVPPGEPQADLPDDADLKDYLVEKGLGFYQPVFANHGVFTLSHLAKLLGKKDARGALRADITQGCVAGGKRYKGSEPAAEMLDALVLEDVQREAERRATARAETRTDDDTKKLAKSKKDLEQAMREVEALRAACEKSAKEGRDAAVKTAREGLKSVLKRANAKELLDGLTFGDKTTIEEVRAQINAVQSGLDAKILDTIERAIDTRRRPPSELADEHGLMRGFCVDAGGCEPVSGGDLLDMAVRTIDAPPTNNITLICSSESHYGSAQRIVQTAQTAFSTANKAKGAAFLGSGIGAASAAGNHARARQQDRDEATAEQTKRATHYRLDYIWEPHGGILLPSTEFRLSKSALEALAQLAKLDKSRQREGAEAFLRNFGSHVFARVILGGWYRHVASATSNSEQSLQNLDSALSDASSWAVSVAGSYVGLAGAGMLGTANQGDKVSATGRSERMTREVGAQRVEITTAVLGGMTALPIDHWKASVIHSAHWKPIDRADPHAIWEILKYCGLPSDLEPHRYALARLLETAWIEDIFLPSIETEGDPKLRAIAERKFEDCAALTKAIRQATAGSAPAMRLALFRKRFEPASQHFRNELVLPKGYKILSGGVEATGQTAGNLIVSSYPAVEDGKWRWKAAVKDSRQESKAVHIISVVALYDPDDTWDVRVVRRISGARQARQSQTIPPSPGYVITGGGVRVDPFDDTHVLACGFGPAPGGDPNAARSWTSVSEHYLAWNRNLMPFHFGGVPWMDLSNPAAAAHQQELVAIMVRTPEKARLLVEFEDHRFGEQPLHEELVVHGGSATMIGGGVIAGGRKHWLTGSNPAIDDGTLMGWHAASREHPKPGPSTLEVCTVAVRNAQWISAEDLPGD